MEILNDRFLQVGGCRIPEGVLTQSLGTRSTTEHSFRSPIGGRQPLLAVGRQQTEYAVLEPAVKKSTDVRLMLLTLIRVEANADEVARSVNEFLGCEQTVLRGGVARSEYPRDTMTLCGCGDKHNRPPASLGFRLGRLPGGVPSDARFAEIQLGRAKIRRSRTLTHARLNKRWDHAICK